jgi:hypothetical protein
VGRHVIRSGDQLVVGADSPDATNVLSVVGGSSLDGDVLLEAGVRAAGLPAWFVYPGVAGLQSTVNAGFTKVGVIVFDPTLVCPGNAAITREVRFRCVLETTSVAAACEIQLWNLDDGEIVTGTDLSSVSLTAERLLSAALTVGAVAGNIKSGLRTYEVQILRNGGGSTAFVTCSLAQLEATFV